MNDVRQEKIDFNDKNDSSIAYAINYYTKNSNMLDSQYIYDKRNNVSQIYHYLNGKEAQYIEFENNHVTFKYNYLDNVYIRYDNEGLIVQINDFKDSSQRFFYTNSNALKTYKKFDYRGVFYSNDYDSSTNTIISCYRRSYDQVKRNNDTLFLKICIPDHLIDLRTFQIKIDILDNGQIVKSFSKNGINPLFKIPLKSIEKLEWKKTICDQFGCFASLGQFYNSESNPFIK